MDGMERKKDNKRKKDSSFLKSLTDWDLTLLLMENLETNLALNNQNHAIYEGFFNDLNTILIEYIDEQNRKNSTDIKLDRFRLKTLQYTNNKLENQNYNHEKIYNDNITMYNTIIDLWKRLGNEQNQKPNDDAITNLQEKIKKFTDTENILTNQQIAVLINFRNNLMSFTREGIVYIPSLSHSIKKYAVNTDGTLNKTNFEKILKFNQNISNLDIKTFNDTLASINVELLDEKALEIRKQTQQQQQNQQQIQSNLTTSLYNQSIQFQPQQQQFQLQQQFQQQNDNFYSFGAGQSSLQNNSSISFDLSNSDNNQQSMPIQQQQFQLQQQKIKPQNDFNSSLKFSQQEQSLQQQNQQQIQVEDDNHDIPEEGVTSRIINKKNGFQTMSTVKVGDTFIKQMLGKLGEQSSTIQTQQQKIKNLENQLNQKNSKQIKLSMVQEENEEIDVDYYYTLIAENQQLRAENEKLTQENKKLTTHNTALTQKNKELEKQNKNLETEITNFKQQGSFRKKKFD